MTKSMLMLIALAIVLCGCQQTTAVKKVIPPDKTLDIQELVNSARTGDIIQIPYGRYVLKKGIIIQDKIDLKIHCAIGTEILVDDIYEDIFSIEGSEGITIENGHFRHKTPSQEYECHGGVVRITESKRVSILNCELDGCGAFGVFASQSQNITVKNCHIHDNSFNAVYLAACKKVQIHSNRIEDNANLFQIYGVDDLEVCNNIIQRNGGYWQPFDKEPGRINLDKTGQYTHEQKQ